jgi:pSer/pThr/pTyr-binding forkhead associated (FHA) protein
VALILEIRDARGVSTWHRLDALPVTIGRAPSNDIILDDPYLDARHARIDVGQDGVLQIDDLGSLNGLVSEGARASSPLALTAGQELRAGRTTFRFRDVHEEVPAALRDDLAATPSAAVAAASAASRADAPAADAPVLPAILATRARRSACCVAMLVAFALNAWLSDTTRSSGSTVFGAVLGFAVLAGLWAALWAAAGRAVVHRFRFLAHAAVVSMAMIVMLAWSAANDWLSFIYPDAKIAWVLSLAIFLVVLASLVSAHLALATGVSWKRQRRTGLFVSGAVVALLVVAALVSDDKFTDVPKFASQLKPMSTRWVPTHSVGEFGAAARELREEVDEDAKKAIAP